MKERVPADILPETPPQATEQKSIVTIDLQANDPLTFRVRDGVTGIITTIELAVHINPDGTRVGSFDLDLFPDHYEIMDGITGDGRIATDFKRRIQEAIGSFYNLEDNVWSSPDIASANPANPPDTIALVKTPMDSQATVAVSTPSLLPGLPDSSKGQNAVFATVGAGIAGMASTLAASVTPAQAPAERDNDISGQMREWERGQRWDAEPRGQDLAMILLNQEFQRFVGLARTLSPDEIRAVDRDLADDSMGRRSYAGEMRFIASWKEGIDREYAELLPRLLRREINEQQYLSESARIRRNIQDLRNKLEVIRSFIEDVISRRNRPGGGITMNLPEPPSGMATAAIPTAGANDVQTSPPTVPQSLIAIDNSNPQVSAVTHFTSLDSPNATALIQKTAADASTVTQPLVAAANPVNPPVVHLADTTSASAGSGSRIFATTTFVNADIPARNVSAPNTPLVTLTNPVPDPNAIFQPREEELPPDPEFPASISSDLRERARGIAENIRERAISAFPEEPSPSDWVNEAVQGLGALVSRRTAPSDWGLPNIPPVVPPAPRNPENPQAEIQDLLTRYRGMYEALDQTESIYLDTLHDVNNQLGASPLYADASEFLPPEARARWQNWETLLLLKKAFIQTQLELLQQMRQMLNEAFFDLVGHSPHFDETPGEEPDENSAPLPEPPPFFPVPNPVVQAPPTATQPLIVAAANPTEAYRPIVSLRPSTQEAEPAHAVLQSVALLSNAPRDDVAARLLNSYLNPSDVAEANNTAPAAVIPNNLNRLTFPDSGFQDYFSNGNSPNGNALIRVSNPPVPQVKEERPIALPSSVNHYLDVSQMGSLAKVSQAFQYALGGYGPAASISISSNGSPSSPSPSTAAQTTSATS